MNWLKSIFSKQTQSAKPIENRELNEKSISIRNAGSLNEQHYTGHVELIKKLKRENNHQEAIPVLLKCIDATELESNFADNGCGVAPWYYEQLAIIYRKEKLYKKEVEVLERYARQTKSIGAKASKLEERLIKAKNLLANSNGKGE